MFELFLSLLGKYNSEQSNKHLFDKNELKISKDYYDEGWYFDKKTISYRICDVWDLHSEGWDWYFGKDSEYDELLKNILLENNFSIEYNSGDEEDCLVIFQYNS